MTGYFDEEAMDLVKRGINPLTFSGLKTTITADESKAINFDDEPKIIISASGMCEAGRIRHHLKHNLWRNESTIVFVGHQSVGTLGRIILDGVSEVKLFGELIQVNAQVRRLSGVSGHADRDGLLKWIGSYKEKPDRVFVVHGEDDVSEGFKDHLVNELGYNAVAPFSGTVYDLMTNELIVQGQPIAVGKKKTERATFVYERLLGAGRRLLAVIKRNEDGSNKDLSKFTDAINSLSDKWDR
jgi:metallo-beta-lactamase family protein